MTQMSHKDNFIFRADAGAAIGSGHVMRCISLAQALMKEGAHCLFVTAGRAAADRIEAAGIPCRLLKEDAAAAEKEGAFLDFLAKKDGCTVILDSYDVTAGFMQALREKARLVYFDDLAAFPYPADGIINYNLDAAEETYRALYRESGVEYPREWYLGPSFTPLREVFADCGARRFDGVKNVLVTCGGADTERILPAIAGMIGEEPALSDIRFRILSGSLLDAAEVRELRTVSEKSGQITLLPHTDKMKELIESCDLAVSAAGSTLHELCACGTPAICYVTADNQIRNALSFAEAGLMEYAGDCRDREKFLRTLRAALIGAAKRDGKALAGMSAKMQETEDGKGAARLSKRLMEAARGNGSGGIG